MELVKVFQAYFIGQDIEMYHEETDTPAKARTSTLSEELGQIQYVLSDKTGTLTQNKMEFFGCTIGGKAYGIDLDPNDASDEGMRGEVERKSPTKTVSGEDAPFDDRGLRRPYARKCFTFEDPTLFDDLLIHDPLGKDSAPLIEDGRMSFVSVAAQEEYFGLAQNILSREFFRHMSLCHSVIPEIIGEDHHEANAKTIFYQAQSPDESALVSAARDFGFTFIGKSGNSLHIDVLGKEFDYELLHILEFSSTRKRMSVIVRCPITKKVVLLCKGADDVIFERLAEDISTVSAAQEDMYLRDNEGTVPIGSAISLYVTDPEFYASVKNSTAAHLRDFASLGLRTLCFAIRYIEENEYEVWRKRFFEAETVHDNREEKMFELASEIETELVLLGSTAVEDKLQVGVPECIATLMQATIKVWVLTGDKQETAINIGFSSCLLNEDMTVVIVNASDLESTQRKLEEVKKQYFMYEAPLSSSIPDETEEALMIKLKAMAKNMAFWNSEKSDSGFYDAENISKDASSRPADSMANSSVGNRQCALVIDGATLQFALQEECRELFLSIALQCCSVVCCRCSPLQKSSVVRLVRSGTDAKVLAIGDGANDVSMIRAADVGVGISGKEGLQAVLASDYAFAQFRFLTRLLLVHGRWSYNRICWMILYFFYKNYAFVLANFWYAFFSGYSAETIYENTYIMLYNLAFTSLPPMFLAVFDQDLPDVAVISVPELYRTGLTNSKFNSKLFWRTVAEAIYQSLVFFFVPMLAVGGVRTGTDYTYDTQSNKLVESASVDFVTVSSITRGANDPDLWVIGAVIYLGVVTVVNLRVALDTQNWTWMNHLVTWISIAGVFIYVFAFSFYPPRLIPIFGNTTVGVGLLVFASPVAWFSIIMIVVLSMGPRFVYDWFKLTTDPTDADIVREMWRFKLALFSKDLISQPEEGIEASASDDEDSQEQTSTQESIHSPSTTLTQPSSTTSGEMPKSLHKRTTSLGTTDPYREDTGMSSEDITGSAPNLSRKGRPESFKTKKRKFGHRRAQTEAHPGMGSGRDMDDSSVFTRRKSNTARRVLSNQSLYRQAVLSSESLHATRSRSGREGNLQSQHRRFLSENVGIMSTPNIRDVEDNLHYRVRLGHRRRSTVVTIADDLNVQPISHTGFAFN